MHARIYELSVFAHVPTSAYYIKYNELQLCNLTGLLSITFCRTSEVNIVEQRSRLNVRTLASKAFL